MTKTLTLKIDRIYEDMNNMEKDIVERPVDRVVMRGWRCAVTDRPEAETPVLACVHGLDAPIVLELRWETCNPMIESYFKDFLYWDNPNDDGQDFEDRVFAWREIPELPSIDA